MCRMLSLQLFRWLSPIAFVRMPDGPLLACRTARRSQAAMLPAVVHAADPPVRSFASCRARPSMTRWILSLQTIRRLSNIAFDCMPDGPSTACRTARRLDAATLLAGCGACSESVDSFVSCSARRLLICCTSSLQLI